MGMKKDTQQAIFLEVSGGKPVMPAVCSVPENESWLHEPFVKRGIENALVWAVNNPAKESNPDDLGAFKN